MLEPTLTAEEATQRAAASLGVVLDAEPDMVHMAEEGGEFLYHHGALVMPWKGRVHVAWQAAARDVDLAKHRQHVARDPTHVAGVDGHVAPAQ